jgi:hypothetical protein
MCRIQCLELCAGKTIKFNVSDYGHVSNLIWLDVAVKTSCNVVEMSHVANSEKDKLELLLFPDKFRFKIVLRHS